MNFACHASGRRNAPQIFVTTHQPYFYRCSDIFEETWILEKSADGFATITVRASNDQIVRALVE